jgi:hypothetical protein
VTQTVENDSNVKLFSPLHNALDKFREPLEVDIIVTTATNNTITTTTLQTSP